ncbi:MAG: AMP-binding protein, partial [Actinomycetota bacterium]
MPDYLTAHAQSQPNKPAVIDDRPNGSVRTLNWKQLNDESNRLAHVLINTGHAQPGNKVLWCGQNSIGVVVMIGAARKLGVTAVPLNYRLSDDESAYVTDHCDATVVFVDADNAATFERIRSQVPKVKTILVYGGKAPDGMLSADELMAAASTDEPVISEDRAPGATMIYTSGTTGKPKGALRTSPASTEQGIALVGLLGSQASDVYLTTGPIYHSGPGGFMATGLAMGQTVVVQRKFDPLDWLRLVDKYKVTSTFSAPTPIRMVCNLPADVKAKYDVTSMKRMVANAAPWSMTLKHMYLESFPHDSLYEIYGSTELGVNCVLLPEDQLRKPGSCG